MDPGAQGLPHDFHDQTDRVRRADLMTHGYLQPESLDEVLCEDHIGRCLLLFPLPEHA